MKNQQGKDETRLPDAGAGFVWDASGPAVCLRPRTGRAAAAFTTRLGGACPPPWDTLNIAFSVGDGSVPGWRDLVAANRRVAGGLVGAGGEWAITRQKHTADVVRAGKQDLARPPEQGLPRVADAIWTDDRAFTLAVSAADCCPVLLAGDGTVAAAHAGWRGMVAGVVENAARACGAVEAFAGPAIGPCCFEVGIDVAQAFVDRFGERVLTDHRHVDLWLAAEAAADRAGVGSFAAARVCTACRGDLLFSHRRDAGRTGRQALVVRLP